MSCHIIQHFVILSLLQLSLGNFFDIQPDLEYNFHITYLLGYHSESTSYTDKLTDAELKVQKFNEDEYFCNFHNFRTPEYGNEELEKPFIVKMNKTRIGSITYPSTWKIKDIFKVHGFMKGLFNDRKNVTKFLDPENFSEKQELMMALGKCDAHISTFNSEKNNEKSFTIKAESKKDHCEFTDEEKRILTKYVDLVDDSSYNELQITYIAEIPIEVYVKLALRYPSEGSMVEIVADLTINWKDTKEIETKIEVEEEALTITKDEILDMHKLL